MYAKPIKMTKLAPLEMDVRVTVTRRLRVRMWIATRLIALAGRIIGGRVRVYCDGETADS